MRRHRADRREVRASGSEARDVPGQVSGKLPYRALANQAQHPPKVRMGDHQAGAGVGGGKHFRKAAIVMHRRAGAEPAYQADRLLPHSDPSSPGATQVRQTAISWRERRGFGDPTAAGMQELVSGLAARQPELTFDGGTALPDEPATGSEPAATTRGWS